MRTLTFIFVVLISLNFSYTSSAQTWINPDEKIPCDKMDRYIQSISSSVESSILNTFIHLQTRRKCLSANEKIWEVLEEMVFSTYPHSPITRGVCDEFTVRAFPTSGCFYFFFSVQPPNQEEEIPGCALVNPQHKRWCPALDYIKRDTKEFFSDYGCCQQFYQVDKSVGELRKIATYLGGLAAQCPMSASLMSLSNRVQQMIDRIFSAIWYRTATDFDDYCGRRRLPPVPPWPYTYLSTPG